MDEFSLKTSWFHWFLQLLAQIKENIKAPRHWPLCWEFTKFSNAENVSIWWLHRVNFLSGWKIRGTSIYGFWICVPRLIWVVFFDLRPNKRLSKQSWGWWSGTPSRLLWRHCNEIMQQLRYFQDILDIDRHIKHQGAKIYARSHCSVITITHLLWYWYHFHFCYLLWMFWKHSVSGMFRLHDRIHASFQFLYVG